MSAERYDNPLRYMVASHTRKETQHLVELDAYDGNGSCTCEHFMFRLGPQLSKQGAQPGDANRCHHIKEARERFTNDLMALIKKKAGDK